MIYTCTLNPSLDYFMEFETPIEQGKVNRSQLEYYEAGGKGINVSIVLNNLMIPSRAFGFVGGFTKHFYIDLLQKYEYIQPYFTYIDGHTRINIKLNADIETDINAAGPYITAQNMDQLVDKVGKTDKGDFFVFSGNCPEYLSQNAEMMIQEAIERGVRVVLDTSPYIVNHCLAAKPFLVKTSRSELEDLFETSLTSDEEVVEKAKLVHDKGAQNVIVSSSTKGSILVCDEGVFECPSLEIEKVVNTVGTGDSMVAGFVMNFQRSSDAVDSFKFANCCGAATSFTKGLATRDTIDGLYEKIVVKKMG